MPRQMPLVCMGLGFEVPVGRAVRREVWSKKKHTAVGNASLTPVGLRIWMTGNVLLGFVGKPKENCLTKVRLTRLCELSLSVKELKTGKRDQNRTELSLLISFPDSSSTWRGTFIHAWVPWSLNVCGIIWVQGAPPPSPHPLPIGWQVSHTPSIVNESQPLSMSKETIAIGPCHDLVCEQESSCNRDPSLSAWITVDWLG